MLLKHENRIKKIRGEKDYSQNGEHQICRLRRLFHKLSYALPTLQSKKYLFVGNMDNDLGRLKRSSRTVFMIESTDNINNISVDAITI